MPARVTWLAPADTGTSAITGYELQKRATSAGTFAALASPTGVFYVDPAGVTGNEYRVRAVNSTGPSSSWSPTLTCRYVATFTAGDDSWVADGNTGVMGRTTQRSRHGGSSLVWVAGPGTTGVRGPTFALTAGEVVHFHAFIDTDNVTATNALVGLEFFDAGGNYVSETASASVPLPAGGGTWTQLSIDGVVVPAGATQAWMYVTVFSASGGASFFIDDVGCFAGGGATAGGGGGVGSGAPGAGLGSATRHASMETTDPFGFDGTANTNGYISRSSTRAYEGSYSAEVHFNAQANGQARAHFGVTWTSSSDIWYGAAFYLPTGFLNSIASNGHVAIMRWDNNANVGTTADQGGIQLYGSDKKARLYRNTVGVNANYADISSTFDLPEATWFWLEVRQKFGGDGTAINEVWVNNTRVIQNTTRNWYDRNISHMRYGLVATTWDAQWTPLTLYMDRATISNVRIGAV